MKKLCPTKWATWPLIQSLGVKQILFGPGTDTDTDTIKWAETQYHQMVDSHINRLALTLESAEIAPQNLKEFGAITMPEVSHSKVRAGHLFNRSIHWCHYEHRSLGPYLEDTFNQNHIFTDIGYSLWKRLFTTIDNSSTPEEIQQKINSTVVKFQNELAGVFEMGLKEYTPPQTK